MSPKDVYIQMNFRFIILNKLIIILSRHFVAVLWNIIIHIQVIHKIAIEVFLLSRELIPQSSLKFRNFGISFRIAHLEE